MRPSSKRRLACLCAALFICAWPFPACAATGLAAEWWYWPALLFAVSFVLGVVAVPAGIGGGTLLVPVVAAFFPFHLDYVRATGLLVAMAGALAAGPALLRNGLADLRLGMPAALIASLTAVGGAAAGMALPAAFIEIALGALVLLITGVMAFSRRAATPQGARGDALATALGLGGSFVDAADRRTVDWRVHRTAAGLLLFAVIGFLAGLFGIGAGWANVPVLNLLMGVPLKVALGTSSFIISVSSSAGWIYLHEGAILPLIAAPAVAGMMLGARLGARLLDVLPAPVLRWLVVVMLFLAGARMLAKGLGV